MPKTDDLFTGVGRRKSAVAQTRIHSGRGTLTVNGKEKPWPRKVTQIFELVGRIGELDAEVIVRGGGITGQKDAIALGIARALVELNPDFRSTLRKAGYLTRDARITERKKPGLKKARRAPQWAKR
ncbi:MAG: 30S ribosomal protein S9 [Candidatus Berkelbacteria bacterium]|nr:MAG: 30S ribosomal protein S9 [Candidatus Berkelbacteria bacterium]QQG52123.1 MAG: 30S ribosomal protein S9 [Candidatus Berkelbacteria bacterium]